MIGKIDGNLTKLQKFGNNKPAAENDPLYQTLNLSDIDKDFQAGMIPPQNFGKPENISTPVPNFNIPNNNPYMVNQNLIDPSNNPAPKKKDGIIASMFKSTWGKALMFLTFLTIAALAAKKFGLVGNNPGTSKTTCNIIPNTKNCFENEEKKTVYGTCINFYNRAKNGVLGATNRVKQAVKRKPKTN